jgi:hypothetical protein
MSFLIEGTLELHTKLYTPIRLEKGDSASRAKRMGISYAWRIAPDRSSNGMMRSTASMRIASLGMPNTTQLCSS